MAEKKAKSGSASREEETLAFWQKNDIFKKTLEKDAPKGEYIFYDGPPFATGLPHYGHIVASVIKDVVPRYQTMRGYHVPRVWGWDCHGLPIENIVEKELGIKHKKDIVKMGVAKFNELCRSRVLTYAHEWEKIIPRIGRWADMEHAYRTMDKPYMESVWWVFKQLWDKGLVYEDYRSMHICPRCETTLSQQEVAEGYKDVKDIAVTVKFELVDEPGTYFLAWTTTPWTLPGNVALAVGADIEYVKAESPGAGLVWVSKDWQMKVAPDAEVVEKKTGNQLVDTKYKPPFDYYANDTSLKNRENGWKVYAADFVTAEDGTGIAHEAPAFGADDWELAKRENLPFVQHVNFDGTFKSEVTDLAGKEVKPIQDPMAADVEIIKYLAKKGLLFAKEKIEHSYPHCWRCDTPLLNYATSSWFVAVTQFKDELLKNAEPINWSPAHIKEGRWGNWLEGARDWAISRQRFWASVMPIWVCEKCKEKRVFGSAAELEEASGQKIDDLHKHVLDEVTVSCACGGIMRRVPDVLDTWFDSGSMPYGERHYPFENKEEFDRSFPANFIAEGVDQTRAWFYYLHVLAGALFGKRAFQNVVVNGIVLAEDGKKMSKRLQNYPDPMEMVDKYGADALRFYMLSSPVMQAENLSFSERGVEEVAKKNIGRLVNVLEFYLLYEDATPRDTKSSNVLDQWILARTAALIAETTAGYEAYELDTASRPLTPFIDDLSVWYIRRSRERFSARGLRPRPISPGLRSALGGKEDRQCASATLRYVLHSLSRVMAPSMPFLAEHIFQAVRESEDEESVHLAMWQEVPTLAFDPVEVLTKMFNARAVVSRALEIRDKAGIKVRQPLARLHVPVSLGLPQEYLDVIRDEVNVREVAPLGETIVLDTTISEELREEGVIRDAVRIVQAARKEANLNPKDHAMLTVDFGSVDVTLVKKNIEQIEKATNTELQF
ncbi:MAG TPA: isoleucine--tRNA ligase [Candidatus Paceibacterota bacterium]